MAIERMLTEEMPAQGAGRARAAEAGIEMVFGISGGHTGRIVSGLGQIAEPVRMVTVREESLGGVMAEVYGRLTRRAGGDARAGAVGARQRADRHDRGVSVEFADGAVDRFQRRAALSSCTRPISRRPAIRAAGTRAAPSAASPSRSCRRRSRSPRCRRPSWRSSTRWPASRGRSRSCSATTRWPAIVAPGRRAGALSDPLLSARRRRRRPTRRGSRPPPRRILAARTPVIIAGNGVRIAQGYEQLRRLAETAGMPVATTAAGKGCFAETHPLALGVFGTFGTAAANACVGEADLVLVVGSKLSPERHRLGKPRIARPDAAELRPGRHRAAQRLVELPGRAGRARRRGADPRASCARRSRSRGNGRANCRAAGRRPPRARRAISTTPAYFADDGRSCRSG